MHRTRSAARGGEPGSSVEYVLLLRSGCRGGLHAGGACAWARALWEAPREVRPGAGDAGRGQAALNAAPGRCNSPGRARLTALEPTPHATLHPIYYYARLRELEEGRAEQI